MIRDRPEAQRVHYCYRPCAHGEDVAQDSAHARGRSLERLNEAGMIVRFDFERAGPAVADVDDAGVLPRSLHHQLAAGGQALQVHARRFVGTVLAPHHAEDAEFGQRGLAVAQKLLDFFVLVRRKPVLPEDFRSGRRSQGSGHEEPLLSHFGAREGRKTLLGTARASRCHPERGRRPGEGPYDAHEWAWALASVVTATAAKAVLSAATVAETVVGSLTRLRRVQDDKPLEMARASRHPTTSYSLFTRPLG